MKKIEFPKGFTWGAATSSYQIEGAWNEDDKGESVWDVASHTKGLVINGDTGDIACDHYHRYKEDVHLMKEIGLKAYRFSISWPRLFPSGKGKVNSKGVAFYDNLIDELLANEIEPVITLYHWDLPNELQKIGGWESRDVVDAYVEYAKFMFDHYGDRVKFWITFNEPLVFTIWFYSLGLYGFRSMKRGYEASHLVNVAHAKTIAEYRTSQYSDGKIGITLNLGMVYPLDDTPLDKKAAQLVDGMYNRWFIDPILKATYPEDVLNYLKEQYDFPSLPKDDLKILEENPIDFLGINNYSGMRVRAKKEEDFKNVARLIQRKKEKGKIYSETGWEVCPECFYDLLIRVDRDYNHIPIYITENGMACKDDVMTDGIVQDNDRVSYLEQYIEAANRAINEGANIKGYFVWSLLDNFEWISGYSKRFGIIRVNYDTQERKLKKSAFWYKNTIANNGFDIDL